jgi:hypothetical protein
LKGSNMSRESMLLLAGGSVVIALMVLFYDSQHSGVKGIGKKTTAAISQKQSVVSETDNADQADSDTNAVNQADPTMRKLSKTANKTPQRQQISKERFIAFDAWPSSACPNTPDGDANQQPAQTGDENSASAATPQSALDEEFKSTSQLYKGLADRLDKQGLNTGEYNIRVRKLQNEYDEKIKKLFQKKQKLDATQKMIDIGSINPEEGKTMMWRLVLPEETVKALPAKSKASVKPPAAKPIYGTVTGITHSNEAPLVMIDGEIYGEGASFHGVRIAKIYQQSVDFEYKGFTWSQGVNDSPSPNWP